MSTQTNIVKDEQSFLNFNTSIRKLTLDKAVRIPYFCFDKKTSQIWDSSSVAKILINQ